MAFGNPLLPDDDDDNLSGIASGKEAAAEPTKSGQSNARLAKVLREGKDLRALNQANTTELAAKENEISQLKAENRRLGGEVSVAMDGAAASLAADAEALATMATAAAAADAAATAAAAAEQNRWDTRRPSQVLAMVELVDGGVLSEAAAGQAKDNFAHHLAVQMNTQRLRDEQQQWQNELTTMRREDETTTMEQRRAVQKLTSLSPEAAKAPSAFAARQSLAQWLETSRLSRHELKVSIGSAKKASVAGSYEHNILICHSLLDTHDAAKNAGARGGRAGVSSRGPRISISRGCTGTDCGDDPHRGPAIRGRTRQAHRQRLGVGVM